MSYVVDMATIQPEDRLRLNLIPTEDNDIPVWVRYRHTLKAILLRCTRGGSIWFGRPSTYKDDSNPLFILSIRTFVQGEYLNMCLALVKENGYLIAYGVEDERDEDERDERNAVWYTLTGHGFIIRNRGVLATSANFDVNYRSGGCSDEQVELDGISFALLNLKYGRRKARSFHTLCFYFAEATRFYEIASLITKSISLGHGLPLDDKTRGLAQTWDSKCERLRRNCSTDPSTKDEKKAIKKERNELAKQVTMLLLEKPCEREQRRDKLTIRHKVKALQSVPLKKIRMPKAKAYPGRKFITNYDLRQIRRAFWNDAIKQGSKDIWLQLYKVAASVLQGDLAFARTILQHCDVVILRPDLTLLRDDRGFTYILPEFLLRDPTNVKGEA